MMLYLLVGVGGALGALLRYLVTEWVSWSVVSRFPWGIWCCNVLGSLLIGFLCARQLLGAKHHLNAFLMVGLLGGFTTFSSFSLDTVQLFLNHQWVLAGCNVLVNVVFCLLGCYLGMQVGQFFNSI